MYDLRSDVYLRNYGLDNRFTIAKFLLTYKYYLDKKEYGLSKKLQHRYVGPYQITRKISPVVYEIRKENGKLKTVSIMNLKPVV